MIDDRPKKKKKITKRIIKNIAIVVFFSLLIFGYFSLSIIMMQMNAISPFDFQRLKNNASESERIVEKVVNTNSLVAHNTPSINDKGLKTILLNIHKNIMFSFATYIDDVVFITDPFYAINFVGNSTTGYERFYSQALDNTQYAKMFVLQEPANKEVHSIQLGEITQHNFLRSQDYLYIKYARKVIVSPLLKIIAPLQYQAILDIRKEDFNDIQTIAFDEPINMSDYISVDYTDAMLALGKIAATLSMEKNESIPQIYLILDTQNIRSITYRTEAFLRGVFSINPHITITYKWASRIGANEGKTAEELATIPLDAIVLMDAGQHTYPVLSKYLSENESRESAWKDRFLAVSYLWPEHNNIGIPIVARVEIPQDFLFENNNNIKAILRRIKK